MNNLFSRILMMHEKKNKFKMLYEKILIPSKIFLSALIYLFHVHSKTSTLFLKNIPIHFKESIILLKFF